MMKWTTQLATACREFKRKLDADLMSMDLWRRSRSACEAAMACDTAARRLESKGQKGSDSWHIQKAFFQVHENNFRNVQLAITAQKEFHEQHNTCFWKTARWFRDWFY
jgi:hypothetical protein